MDIKCTSHPWHGLSHCPRRLSFLHTTGQLLEHIGGNINPLRVIQKIPEGLQIDMLRWEWLGGGVTVSCLQYQPLVLVLLAVVLGGERDGSIAAEIPTVAAPSCCACKKARVRVRKEGLQPVAKVGRRPPHIRRC